MLILSNPSSFPCARYRRAFVDLFSEMGYCDFHRPRQAHSLAGQRPFLDVSPLFFCLTLIPSTPLSLFRDGAQRLARHGFVVAAARRVRVQLHVGGGLGAPSRRRA